VPATAKMKSYSVLNPCKPVEGKLYISYDEEVVNAIHPSVLLNDGAVEFNLDNSDIINVPVRRLVSFDEFAQYSDDHGLISVYTEMVNPQFLLENTIQRTFIGRKPIRDFFGKRLVAQIITPYKNSDPSEWDMIVLDDGFAKIDGFPEFERYDLLTDWHKVKFKDNLELVFEGTATVDSKIEIDVHNMIPAPIFLETTAGNLSHYRVEDTQKVVLDTSGLRHGEVVKIKAGRRYYPGLKELLITLQ
jgi:hypothetical protein